MISSMILLQKYKNIEFIQVSAGHYAVRKLRWIFGPTYFQLNLNGTCVTCRYLISGVTITDDPERAQHIFNCNALKRGKL